MIRIPLERRTAVPIACLLVLAFLYYGWTWSDELGDFGGDNTTYLLTARHFSPWSGPDAVAAYFATHSPYPPLYPLVLALFGGDSSVLAAHFITTTALLLTFVALYFWLCRLGISSAKATGAVAVFALLPGTYMHGLLIHSENLYLLLTLLSFLAVTSYETDQKRHWLWLSCVAIACAALTRSAGISLVAAFVLYLLLHRPSRYGLPGAAVFAPIALWQWWGAPAGPGYVSALIERYSSESLATLFAQRWDEMGMLWMDAVGNFTTSPVGAPVMAVVGGFCLAGTACRIRQRRLDGFYAIFYLLLIVVWPYPAEAPRFLLVMVPVLLAHGVWLLDRLPKPKAGAFRFHPSVFMLIALAIIAMPSLLFTGQRFFQAIPEFADLKRSVAWYTLEPQDAVDEAVSFKLLSNHIKSIGARMNQTDCVYSIKPSLVAFYANRISLVPPKEDWDSAATEAYLNRTNCRFFHLIAFVSPSFPSVYYPLGRLPNRLVIVSAGRTPPGPNQRPVALLATYER